MRFHNLLFSCLSLYRLFIVLSQPNSVFLLICSSGTSYLAFLGVFVLLSVPNFQDTNCLCIRLGVYVATRYTVREGAGAESWRDGIDIIYITVYLAPWKHERTSTTRTKRNYVHRIMYVIFSQRRSWGSRLVCFIGEPIG